jgi:hypothetical protein
MLRSDRQDLWRPGTLNDWPPDRVPGSKARERKFKWARNETQIHPDQSQGNAKCCSFHGCIFHSEIGVSARPAPSLSGPLTQFFSEKLKYEPRHLARKYRFAPESSGSRTLPGISRAVGLTGDTPCRQYMVADPGQLPTCLLGVGLSMFVGMSSNFALPHLKSLLVDGCNTYLNAWDAWRDRACGARERS